MTKFPSYAVGTVSIDAGATVVVNGRDPDRVDAAVAALDRVGGRLKETVAQEHEGLLQVGRFQLVQASPQAAVPTHPPPQSLQFRQGRVRPAAPVEQPVD